MEMGAKAGTEVEAKAGTETGAKVGTEAEAKAGMEMVAKVEMETEVGAGMETMGLVRQLGWCFHQTIAGGSQSGLRSFQVLAESVLALQDVHPLP